MRGAAAPLVAYRVAIDRSDDHRIFLRRIIVARQRHAPDQRRAVDMAGKLDIFDLRPFLLVEGGQRRFGDRHRGLGAAQIRQVEFGRGLVVREAIGGIAEIGRIDRRMGAGDRAQPSDPAAADRHAIELPLGDMGLVGNEMDLAAGAVDREGFDVPFAGRDPARAAAGRGLVIELVIAVDIGQDYQPLVARRPFHLPVLLAALGIQLVEIGRRLAARDIIDQHRVMLDQEVAGIDEQRTAVGRQAEIPHRIPLVRTRHPARLPAGGDHADAVLARGVAGKGPADPLHLRLAIERIVQVVEGHAALVPLDERDAPPVGRPFVTVDIEPFAARHDLARRR